MVSSAKYCGVVAFFLTEGSSTYVDFSEFLQIS